LMITLSSWGICFLLAGGSTVSMMSGFALPFIILNFTHVIVVLFAAMMNELWIILLSPLIFNLTFLIMFTVFERRKESRPMAFDIKALRIPVLVIAIGCAMTGAAVLYRNMTTNILPPSYGYAYGNGYSSVDLWDFDIDNANNKLPKLDEPSTFRVDNESDFPILDGAEAAYPVYSAFANACFNYPAMSGNVNKEKVPFTNTIYAFERLIKGEIDIFFGARPSQDQLKLAADAGVELEMTPIAYEAFVFFVNVNNPVSSLTTEQIKQIYSGEIKNWSKLGSVNKKIVAFQRPANSGSQTMLQYIMGDTAITKPLIEEMIGAMGGITEKVASYRDSLESIGFTFKFFLNGMTTNADQVKMLAIDGIEPTEENISSQVYPYTTNLYAITVKGNEKSTVQPFVEWMLGEQGQYIIDQIGYVPIN
jgi:ABC-type phosphate transport system, periplasmic component